MKNGINRRRLLAGAAVGLVGASSQPVMAKLVSKGGGYEFEVQRTDAEWKEMLTPEEFEILRSGGTEAPKSSPYWENKETGIYSCKGCDLEVYDSQYKTQLDKGWVFFFHGIPNTVMFGIDKINPYGASDSATEGPAGHLIEAHCRRCGSHLGHVLQVGLFILHCINGTALDFEPKSA
ncbi:peptide-methionine (R)-S-oxide reductase [Rhodobacteraceae bacterium]|nr:peptide-methionine (R)-S-oxide reductase [Paracoccaceae bacterium]